ncbi:MAG: CSLREA domain-containing protein, partial [Planctomycetaceae bacterium]|nr:CSLREA domain-containing protein [Planctomycetaceae bacterium]
MQLTDWLNLWWSPRKPARRRSRHGKSEREGVTRAKVAAELLEPRMLPAVITVTSLADTIANDGQVTLREAIQAANTDSIVDGSTKGSGADTIQFAPSLTASGPATITLIGPRLLIKSDMTIVGPGEDKLTIDGNNLTRIFTVDDGSSAKANVLISGLTMANGAEASDAAGAILNREALTLISTTIRNSSSQSNGSAIRSEQGPLTISQSTIRDNSGGRGAISVFQGTLTVTQSTISGNSSRTYGAGIDIVLATTIIEQCTIVGNSAQWKGGGILNDAGNVTVSQSTIVGNFAADGGGGIYTFGGSNLTLHNSILIQNTTVGGQANDLAVSGGQLASAKNNLIGDPLTAAGVTNGVNGNIVGADNGSGGRRRLDPITVLNTTLGNNGGPVKTLALVDGSPAIDVGNNSLIPADRFDRDGDGNATEADPFDQRGSGFSRVLNSTVDLGAVEFGSAISILSVTATSA